MAVQGAVLHFPVLLHATAEPEVFHYSISIIFIGSQLGWNNSLGLRYYYVDFQPCCHCVFFPF